MLGVLFTSISTFFQEVSASIGKDGVARRLQGIYTMGFLNSFWTILIFLFLIFIAGQKFVFSFASLPTVGLRMVLELFQADISVRATVAADRSTYSFIFLSSEADSYGNCPRNNSCLYFYSCLLYLVL